MYPIRGYPSKKEIHKSPIHVRNAFRENVPSFLSSSQNLGQPLTTPYQVRWKFDIENSIESHYVEYDTLCT